MSGTLGGAIGRLAFVGVAGGAAAADAANLYFRNNRYSDLYQEQLRFPTDLNRNETVPYMSMQFSAYRRRSINEQPFYEQQMKISLPIPEGLVEQTTLNYDKTELGSAAGAAVEATSGISGALSGSAGEIAANLGGRIATAVTGAGAAAVGRLANAVGPNVTNALSTLTGVTANPFQVVLFKSPDFRSHTFQWKFAPQSAIESDMLRRIIDTFKYHSLPGISAAGGVFFSYPEILEINFRPTDTYLYRFKPCVVDGITVNFTPNSPSFYRTTNAPTAVQITLRVQEIEIWTKADYLRQTGQFNNPVTPEFIARFTRGQGGGGTAPVPTTPFGV